ncbi:PLP-dependent decarboxylase [Pseudoalteromonas sp. McH1-7]|uniref:PLP-dependent decarboxylase n=1 Tax=unclassified Pseudoalteromonas TaxID=194690 RepID=UPI001590147B|nr:MULTISPECIES: PLP-dependent decarboxylase [unclassified Pseudoalteromonas]NUZ12166.1 PLP-dependent decarboxylase [Pseudoalteromonas sp. McH1-7]USD28760.1 PLP-dependent decarboxylase [Pseudoalteromonas sp. SCSIO 43201]
MSWLSTSQRAVAQSLVQQQDTPFFCYDLDKLSAHVKPLVDQQVVKLWYAVKANPLSHIIKTLDHAGFNFDVASSGELDQVLSQGVTPARVLNTGPAKSLKQIRHFANQGVRIFVAESHNQVVWLNQVACEFDLQFDVLLRVQLRFDKAQHNPLGGNTLTPFGLGSEQWQALTLSDYTHLDFVGLHIFQWGNMLCSDTLAELWQAMVSPLVQLASELGIALKVLDLGGGLGIPYDAHSTALNWTKLLDTLASIKSATQVDELWMELGRYAVGECGFYLNPVVEQKQNYGAHQLIVAGGVNHLLRPAVTGQAFPAELLRQSDANTADFHIHGPLCTALDKLGTLALPSDSADGDWLVFSQCGAYGYTESMPFFLCHELPAEFVISGGEVTCARAAQPASSYLR